MLTNVKDHDFSWKTPKRTLCFRLKRLRILVCHLLGRDMKLFLWNKGERSSSFPWPADAVTNDKCNDFCELACYRLAIAPFKRCRAEEQLEKSVCPPLDNQTATERIANTPLLKIFFFRKTSFHWGSGIFFVVERTTDIASLLQGTASFSGRRKYIENGNLVKTKMETVPFSQSFKDDRMTTWRFLRYSMQFSEHFNDKQWYSDRVIIVIYRWFKLIFVAKLVLFYAWVEGKRRLSSFWLPTHQAVCTGSRVSFKQAGSVNEAAGQQIHLFSCKTTSSLALVAMTGR